MQSKAYTSTARELCGLNAPELINLRVKIF